MPIIDLQNISKSYNHKLVLQNIDFFINKNERLALIGKNGSGKSTLVKMITGEVIADSGKIIKSKNQHIALLSQDIVFSKNQSVQEFITQSIALINQIKQEYQYYSEILASKQNDKLALAKLNEASAFLDAHHAWNLDDKVQRIMMEFDLLSHANKSVQVLSGGEQKRVALAALLLQKPDLLILDEPTNHLDVYMVKFLEEMLIREKFSLLFISHDRYFIENLSTKIVEIDNGKLYFYQGGYRSYLQQKENFLKATQKAYDNLIDLLKQEEQWLAKGVKARVKRNEGRKRRLQDLRVKAKENPALIKRISLDLEREKHSFNQTSEDKNNRKKVLFELENISLKRGKILILNNFSKRILRQDKIAIVGKNGSGKSSFLQMLIGHIKPDSGVYKQGEFSFAYFDQERSMLNDDKDLLETFCPNGGDSIVVKGQNTHVFGYMKQWLFPKEYLKQKIGSLSGGEQSRVALALLLTQKVDCLILDEPTNDLDIATINILENYLASFGGALIFVSHDRYFVDKIAQKLLVFKNNGVVEESYQDYSSFLELESELSTLNQIASKSSKKPSQKVKTKVKLGYKDQIAYEALPSEIEGLEQNIQILENCLSDPNCYQKKGLSEVSKDLEQQKAIYEEKLEQYFELEEKLEGLK